MVRLDRCVSNTRLRTWVSGAAIALAIGGASTCHAQASGLAAQESAPAVDTAPPAHPATDDQLREYFSLIGVARTGRVLMSQLVASMRATAAPYYPASFWDDMNTQFLNVDLVAVYIPIYQRYLSSDDMKEVLIFYRSSGGKHLLNAQSMLMRDAQQVLQQKGAAIGQAVYAKHKDEIEAAKKKYEAEHGGAAK